MAGISNPKQYTSASKPKEKRIFPYYAGYSEEFAESVIDSLGLHTDSKILDPWNGSGTTSIASYKKGLTSIGIDLNPVMILVSKASFLSKLDIPSLLPLAHSLLSKTLTLSKYTDNIDILEKWFTSESAHYLRSVENEINKMFVSQGAYLDLTDARNLSEISSLASFFYVVLFRTTRILVADFIGSNPTWIKSPKDESHRKVIDEAGFKKIFLNELEKLSNIKTYFTSPDATKINILMGDTKALPVESKSIDAIITSPPYCTRIDYAVATSLELAILRMPSDKYDQLRRALMGTSTVNKTVCSPSESWGKTCLNFLEQVKNHPSRASASYYYKNHVQYYESLYLSLKEASRVCKNEAYLIFVVQDSHYKNILNDLPLIVEEMSAYLGLIKEKRLDFTTKRTMSAIHIHSKKYIKSRESTESVLIFKKS